MRAGGLVLLLAAAMPFSPSRAAPVDDLASPSPEIRAHAAALIRERHLYHPTPRGRWDALARTFWVGETEDECLRIVHRKSLRLEPLPADMPIRNDPPSVAIGLPLDDCWTIHFQFGKDGGLEQWAVVEEPKVIMVPPPAGFSGTWHIYRMDGQPVVQLYERGEMAPDEE